MKRPQKSRVRNRCSAHAPHRFLVNAALKKGENRALDLLDAQI